MKFLVLLAALPILAHADTLRDDVIGQLYAMKSVYRATYAPAQWKKAHVGYDLDQTFNTALVSAQALPAMTMVESREIFKNFIYAMQDYHVSISFTATEAASLPLTIKGAGDRFFIAFIDRTKLPEATFPYKVGDELVTFGGKPALEAVRAVQAEIPEAEAGTDRSVAELNLTRRRASRGLAVPKGPITLGLLPKGKEQPVEIQLTWDYSPETIFPRGDLNNLFRASAGEEGQSLRAGSSLFRPMMTGPALDRMAAENPHGIGLRKTFTPSLGAKIFETEETNTFHAYIYKNEQGKLIGYLRLPSYVPDNRDFKKAVADFAGIIGRFEEVTDSMVIDQVNNPGGSVFYLYTLASMLTDRPLIAPRHRMSVTQADVAEALGEIKTLSAVTDDESAKKAVGDAQGYPVNYEFAQFSLNYARFIVSEWEAGRKLTRPYWIAGVDHINPAPLRYTKPILVLINSLDFSGGDFFPTILQDNKRATIMGARTAGAGGYVNDIKITNNVGVESFRVTQSIAERVDGNPIENLGVTPDIAYEMTPADYQGNFAPYVAAIKKAISELK